MNKRTYELSLSYKASHDAKADILTRILSSLGITIEDIIESEQNSKAHVSVFFKNYRQAAALKRKLGHYHLQDVDVSLKSYKNQDWQTKWKADFKPFTITSSFDVVPVWMKKKYRKSRRTPIYLDAGLAFGTGMHATTRYMAQLMERCCGRYHSFLDIGTGSGILSIMAAKSDVPKVRGLDISADAVREAKINMKRNGCDHCHITKKDFGKFKPVHRFDFVAANLITHDLMKFKRKLVAAVKPGCYLAVSGISLNNYSLFKESFRSLPLQCLKVHKGEGWVACLYKKRGKLK